MIYRHCAKMIKMRFKTGFVNSGLKPVLNLTGLILMQCIKISTLAIRGAKTATRPRLSAMRILMVCLLVEYLGEVSHQHHLFLMYRVFIAMVSNTNF